MTTNQVMVGRSAPDFTATAVVDGRLKEVSLSSYTEANHWLILAFFPKAWSFICPTEIKAFSVHSDEFLYSRSCAVAFVSTDSECALKAWHNTPEDEGGLGPVHVPLLSDVTRKISKAYGVLNEDEGVAQRALFIVDPKGVLRAISVNDSDVGRSVVEVQRIIDALIFKDEFGEGCPANWKRGDKGINTKASIEGSIELPLNNRKSWTEWARPKLARAWSGQSGRSFVSVANSTATSGTNVTSNVAGGASTGMHSHHSSLDIPRDFNFTGQAGSVLSSPKTEFQTSSLTPESQIGDISEVQKRMEQLHASTNHPGPVGVAT